MKNVLILNQVYFKNNSLNESCYKISYEMLFRSIPSVLKPLRFAHERLLLPFFYIWYITNWSEILKGYDLIILHDGPYRHANYFIKKISQFSNSNTQLKLYYWNQVYDLDKLKLNHRWEVLSFDYKDATENNMRYVGGFFLPEPIKNMQPSYDLIFVGTNKGRFDFLRVFEKQLNQHHIKTHFILVSLKRKFNKIYSSAIPYHQVLEYVFQSKGIVDINMPDLCAALGLAQIRKYDTAILLERKRVAEQYHAFFRKKKWAQLPIIKDGIRDSCCHLYALRINNIMEQQRDEMMISIAEDEVSVNVHFIPLPMLTLFKDLGYKIEDYPQSYDNYSREISLPIYPQLTTEQIDFICKAVEKAYQKVI